MTEMVVVPDSITPRVAWRSFNIDSDGFLASAAGSARWPKMERMEARCYSSVVSYLPYHGSYENSDSGDILVPVGPIQWVPDGPNHYRPVYPKINIVVTRPVAQPAAKQDFRANHNSPGAECQCGIYATDRRSTAEEYGNILARVALWGKVVSHDLGYRAEFAYPQVLFVDDSSLSEMKAVLAGYGVPVMPKSAIERGPGLRPRWRHVAGSGARCLGMAGVAICMAVMANSAIHQFFWGVTGATELRGVIAVFTTMGCVICSLWYWHLLMEIRAWKP